jgi:hypothetical protein
MILPGLYIRRPHACMVASGAKTVETRGYRPPSKHIGAVVALIETKRIGVYPRDAGQVIGYARLVGWLEYMSPSHWEADFSRHCIPHNDADYCWGTTPRKFGWEFEDSYLFWRGQEEKWTVRKGGRVWTTVETEDCELLARV